MLKPRMRAGNVGVTEVQAGGGGAESRVWVDCRECRWGRVGYFREWVMGHWGQGRVEWNDKAGQCRG